MNTLTKQFQLICRILQIVFRIIQVCAVFGFVIFSAIWLFAVTGQFGSSYLSLSGTGFSAAQPTSVVPILLGMIIAFWIALFLARIFRDIRQKQTPFLPSVASRLKMIAVLYLVLGLLLPVIALILGVYSSTFSFNGGNVVFALVCYGLAYVFDYGRELQIQSDETL